MKTIYRLFIAISCCLFIASCEKASNITEVEKELITVKLSCIGEISDIITTPLRSSSSTSQDLCAIQVYSRDDANGKTTPYARGLFDDLSNVSITLVDGNQYKFKVLYLKNAKNKIDNIEGRYFKPFNTSTSSTSSVTNTFDYGNSESFNNLSYELGNFQMYGSLYSRYNDELYYGRIDSYTPSKNGNVSISLKKSFWALKVVANWGKSITKGELQIGIYNAPSLSLPYSQSTNSIETYISLISYDEPLSNENCSENANISINYVVDGTTTPVANQNINFQRNTLTTLIVSIGADPVNDMTFEFESNNLIDKGTIEL